MARKIPAHHVKLKRAYEPPADEDGHRILVDRLWPRGVKKADAAIHEWAKELSPSPGLRKWFGHDPSRWEEFQRRYRAEVAAHPEEIEHLRALARAGPITLVFAARDETRNSAVLLREMLMEQADK